MKTSYLAVRVRFIVFIMLLQFLVLAAPATVSAFEPEEAELFAETLEQIIEDTEIAEQKQLFSLIMVIFEKIRGRAIADFSTENYRDLNDEALFKEARGLVGQAETYTWNIIGRFPYTLPNGETTLNGYEVMFAVDDVDYGIGGNRDEINRWEGHLRNEAIRLFEDNRDKLSATEIAIIEAKIANAEQLLQNARSLVALSEKWDGDLYIEVREYDPNELEVTVFFEGDVSWVAIQADADNVSAIITAIAGQTDFKEEEISAVLRFPED